MARGASSKATITQKILDTFEGAFINDKEIRIPMIEDGELVEIKVVLTAAKTNVGGAPATTPQAATTATAKVEENLVEPTEDEKKNLESLLGKLGLDF